jgi:hypothetical protein
MTTERQKEANRRNAARSTGPRSAGGKARTSKNALKHGLAVSVARDPAKTQEIARLAAAILVAGANLDFAQDESARIAAEANLELGRVREFRAKSNAATPLSATRRADGDPGAIAKRNRGNSLDVAKQFVEKQGKVERYERRAFSRRNRALRKLTPLDERKD